MSGKNVQSVTELVWSAVAFIAIPAIVTLGCLPMQRKSVGDVREQAQSKHQRSTL